MNKNCPKTCYSHHHAWLSMMLFWLYHTDIHTKQNVRCSVVYFFLLCLIFISQLNWIGCGGNINGGKTFWNVSWSHFLCHKKTCHATCLPIHLPTVHLTLPVCLATDPSIHLSVHAKWLSGLNRLLIFHIIMFPIRRNYSSRRREIDPKHLLSSPPPHHHHHHTVCSPLRRDLLR